MTRRRHSARLAALVALGLRFLGSAPARAAQDTYEHSVHIDNNSGTATVNIGGTTNTYQFQVENGISEAALKKMLDIAVRKAGGDWSRLFKSYVETANRESARQAKSLSDGLARIDEGIAVLSQQLGQDEGRDEVLHGEIATILAGEERILDFMVAGQAEQARQAAERTAEDAFEIDKRFGVALRGLVQSTLLVPHQSRLGAPILAAGVQLTYDLAYLDAYHRNVIELSGAFLAGTSRVSAGYESPGGSLVRPLNISAEHYLFEGGVWWRTGIGLRTRLEIGALVRVGWVTYDYVSQQTDATNSPFMYGHVQIPIDVAFSYKPLRWLTLGWTLGGGVELSASDPTLRYTGIGAGTMASDAIRRPIAEAGFDVAISW